jgi:hypothetical protein
VLDVFVFGRALLMLFDGEDLMASKKKRVTLKAVIKEINKTVRQLKKIRTKASAADKKKLDLKIKSIKNLGARAQAKCKKFSIT